MLFYFRISGLNLHAVQLTSGVQFNQWKVLLVAQGSINRTCTLQLFLKLSYYYCGPTYKFLFRLYVFVFQFQLPTTEFKNDKMKHNNTVNLTSQIGRHWSNVTPRSFWSMSRNRSISYHQKYLKKAFYA